MGAQPRMRFGGSQARPDSLVYSKDLDWGSPEVETKAWEHTRQKPTFFPLSQNPQ